MKTAGAFVFAALVSLGAGVSFAQDDLARHKECKFCGMDREKFATSRILLEYQDGSTAGMCSLRCGAVEFALSIDKRPKTIWVGDYETRALIDAEQAVWVIGGSKPGVMTKRAKWALGTKEAAEKFVKENGGEIAAFEPAVKAAFEDLYDDTRAIRDRREAKRKAAAGTP